MKKEIGKEHLMMMVNSINFLIIKKIKEKQVLSMIKKVQEVEQIVLVVEEVNMEGIQAKEQEEFHRINNSLKRVV